VFKLSDDNKILRSDVVSDKELTAIFRDLAKRSLYFLAKCVLSYDKIEKETHFPICQFIQDLSIKRELLLLPRGTFKSTLATISFSIFLLINFPNYSILIANQTDGNAQRLLSEIEQHLEGRNEMMNWLFPELIKPGDRWKPWSVEHMTVPCRTTISGTPSITTIGVGGRAESPHYEVIINDDLIGEKARDSDVEMARAIVWHDGMEPLFKSPVDGIERMSGTHWSGSDLYCKIKKDPRYSVYWKPARDKDTNKLFFPKLLPHEFLDGMKATNYQVFIHQYQNDPSGSAALEFDMRWIRYYKLLAIEDEPVCVVNDKSYLVSEMDIVISVDPAASGDEESQAARALKTGRAVLANNAIGVIGIASDGKVFLLDKWVGRKSGENPERQCVMEIIKMCRKWNGYFRTVVMESYGAQGAFISIFNMLCEQYGERYAIEATPKGMQKAKNVRIRTILGSVAQNGNLYIRYSHDDFESEFKDFPQGKKDVLDMVTWGIYTLKKPEADAQEGQRKDDLKKTLSERASSIGRGGY
jgi:hypothetical protein